MKIKNLIGKRLLACNPNGLSDEEIFEIRVLEVSPSSTWVKTENMRGMCNWVKAVNICPVEILYDERPEANV